MMMLLLALHGIGGPTPAASRAAAHYKFVAKTTTEVDLSAMGAPSQSIVMTVAGYASVAMTDTVGGKVVTVTVDSSSFDAGEFTAAMPAAMTASSRGTVFHIYLVHGAPSAPITSTPMSVQAAQLVPGIELMLVGMRPAGMAERWVDTTTSDTTMAEGGARSTRITGWTTRPGTGGRIQVEGTWTGTTTVAAGGGQMDMQMTGVVHVTAMPGALSESGASSGTGTGNMNMAGSAIPMTVTTEVTAAATP